jgi:hypothetical protein
MHYLPYQMIESCTWINSILAAAHFSNSQYAIAFRKDYKPQNQALKL